MITLFKDKLDQCNQNNLVVNTDVELAKNFAVTATLSTDFWDAALAGAASLIALIFLILGAGFGLTSVSAWAGIAASTFGWAAILLLTGAQLAASGMGGYIASRTNFRWAHRLLMNICRHR